MTTGATSQQDRATRPTHGPDVALRVCVRGERGQVDLVVPFGTEVGELAAAYAERLGLAEPPDTLALPTGRVLEADSEVDEVVGQGALLLAVEAAAVTPGRDVAADEVPADPEQSADDGPVPPRRARLLPSPVARAVLALAVAVALAAGLLGALAVEPPGWMRPTAAGVLALGAVLVALRSAGLGTGRDDAHVAAPALAAAAGFLLAFAPGAGGVLLGLAVAGLAACVVAAVARTGAEEVGEQLLRAWLVVGAGLCAAAVAWLLLGADLLALAAVGFAVAVLATRMLPGLAVDVDDEVLLDLDRLAVTAWSARETPRGGRRRYQVRTEMVSELVARSRRTVLAGVLVAVVVATASGPVVVLGLGSDRTTWAAWGGLAMVALGAASVGLVGRTFRSRLPRLLLAGTSGWLFLVCGVALARSLEGSLVWWAVAVVAVVATAVVLTAVQLGRGWRSVWWARVGEVLQTLTGVFVIALVPLATGLFDAVMTSFG